MFYVRDDESGELWSPTPLPIREASGEYLVRHGHGYTRFAYDAHDVALELLQFVPVDDPIKVSRLTLTNHSPRSRRLSVTAYLEWVLGGSRSGSAPFVITEMDSATGAMFARNSWSRDFGTRIAFADLGGAQTAWTGDRTEFLGRNGAPDRPASLGRRERLSGRSGAGFDPCCALQATVEIPAGGHTSVVFFLGQTETREQARALIQRYRSDDLDARLEAVTDGWAEVLSTVQVKTPDRSLDLLLNQWLLYQTLACRLWARTAFYQASGAYGFRDQLQDVMALTVSRPDLTRAQILKAASRQFVEGDVQHWWHEPVGRGVRTRISDDPLWLPYVASHYLDVTADRAILDEAVPFLEGAVLATGQSEAYFEPRIARRARDALRALRAGARSEPRPRGPRPPADGNGRLERRNEPRRLRRQGGERVARLVPARAPSRRGPRSRRLAARRSAPRPGPTMPGRSRKRSSVKHGTAAGTVARISTMARPSGPSAAMPAPSPRSRNRGVSCRAPPIPAGRGAPWRPLTSIWCGGTMTWCSC